MSRLQWKEEYSVGDPTIDLQHKGLFSLIDRLEDTSLDVAAMRVTFEKLDKYVDEHFSDEEEVLKACNYDDLDSHVRQHDEFREFIRTAKDSFKSENADQISIGHNLQIFLRDWLLDHIMKADQAYKDWITKTNETS